MCNCMKAINGVDASRRVAWAKFFSAMEDMATVEEDLDRAKQVLHRICREILHHPRLRNDDPLVVLAQELDRAIPTKS